MAAEQELHSFVNKFWNLCKAGKKANLSLKCENGKAVVQLHLELDSLSDPPPPPRQTYPRPSPSRLRRCARRRHATDETSENLAVILTNKAEATESVAIPTDQTKVAAAQVAPTDNTGKPEAGHDCLPPAEKASPGSAQYLPQKESDNMNF